MDIHPPEGHIGSAKDFFVHMSMIVLGILIALGLDSAAEVYRHHRELREARENILAEVGENKTKLDAALTKAPIATRELQAVLDSTERWLTHTATAADDPNQLGYSVLSLSSTSWESAQVAGVLNYMTFPEVQRFTKVYLLQKQFEGIQDKTVQRWLDLQQIGYIPHEHNLSAIAPERMMEIQRQAASAMSYTTTEIEFANELTEQYGELLKEEKSH